MNPQSWIGTLPLRIVSMLLIVTAAGALYAASRFDSAWWPGVMLSVIAFVTATHWSRGIYSSWMSVAQRVQTVVVSILFGVCYFTVVPPLWLVARTRDSLGLRERDTYWHERRAAERDLESFQRLG